MAAHILSPTNPMFTFPEYLSKEISLQSFSEPNLLPSGVITPPADFTPPLSHLNEYHTPIINKGNLFGYDSRIVRHFAIFNDPALHLRSTYAFDDLASYPLS